MPMGEITFTEDTLRYISLFEKVTGTQVKDCLETEEKLVFVVEKGQGSRAVGKKGENVITFTPTKAGPIPFSCSMGMYRGVINVE